MTRTFKLYEKHLARTKVVHFPFNKCDHKKHIKKNNICIFIDKLLFLTGQIPQALVPEKKIHVLYLCIERYFSRDICLR